VRRSSSPSSRLSRRMCRMGEEATGERRGRTSALLKWRP
jgi:hypothetical protein